MGELYGWMIDIGDRKVFIRGGNVKTKVPPPNPPDDKGMKNDSGYCSDCGPAPDLAKETAHE